PRSGRMRHQRAFAPLRRSPHSLPHPLQIQHAKPQRPPPFVGPFHNRQRRRVLALPQIDFHPPSPFFLSALICVYLRPMPFKSSSARNPETPCQSTPAKTPPLLFPRTRTGTPAENAVPISPAPPPET